MQQTKKLSELCEKLVEYTPMWCKLLYKLKQKQAYVCGRVHTESDFSKELSEVYLHDCLELLKEACPELDLDLKPLDRLGRKVGKYEFTEDEVAPGRGATRYADWAMVGDILTIFDIKLNGWKPTEEHLGSHVQSEYVDKLKPFESLAGGQLGYVIVVPRDIWTLYKETWNRFKQDGGYVVPFYADRKEWMKTVREVMNHL